MSGGKKVSDDDDQDYRNGASSSSRQISRPVQSHLARVYGTLTGVSASAVAGSLLYTNYFAPGNTGLASLLGLVLIGGVMATQSQSNNRNHQLMRLGALLLFGLLEGFSIGPLVYVSNLLNPQIVPQALFSALLIFGSFSMSALYSERRSWLSIGGLLLSALSVMFWMGVVNVFLRSSTLFSLDLYAGLLVFAGFVAYDTQVIVERADQGDRDYVSHGAQVFMDLFQLVVRIMALLNRRERDDNNDRGRGKRRK